MIEFGKLKEFENQYTPKIHDFERQKETEEQDEKPSKDEKSFFSEAKSLVTVKRGKQ